MMHFNNYIYFWKIYEFQRPSPRALDPNFSSYCHFSVVSEGILVGGLRCSFPHYWHILHHLLLRSP